MNTEANNNGDYVNSVAKNHVKRTSFIYDPREKRTDQTLSTFFSIKRGFRQALSHNHLPGNKTYATQKNPDAFITDR